jgi:Holliday junction resolvasome RuvABC endonuclease subunit
MVEPRVLAIDPSINDVGFVVLTNKGDFVRSKHIKSPKESVNAIAKINSIIFQLENEIQQIGNVEEVIIEHTRFFVQNQRTSHAAAQKLNLVKGAIFGMCLTMDIDKVNMVWIPGFNKGNANLLARAKKLPKMTQHERDAFWLGYTWLTTTNLIRKTWIDNPDL